MKRILLNVAAVLLVVGILYMFVHPYLHPPQPLSKVETIVSNLESKYDHRRRECIRGLSLPLHPSPDEIDNIAPAIIRMFQSDPILDYRIDAAKALVIFKDHPSVLPALEAGLNDELPAMRLASAISFINVSRDTLQWFPAIEEAVSADSDCARQLRHAGDDLFSSLNRADWESVSTQLLGLIDGSDTNQRFGLVTLAHYMGIYDAEYVPDLEAQLDPWGPSFLNATRMLSEMGELGADAVPLMLTIWDSNEYTAESKQYMATQYMVKFGPLLAPYLDQIVSLLKKNRGDCNLVQLIAAIGPEAEPAIPTLVEVFRSIDHRYWNGNHGDIGLHANCLLALGSIGPPAADAGVPLCLEYYSNQCERDREERGAPLRALGMLGNGSPQVMDVLITALDETDRDAQGEAMIAVMRLSPDDPRFLAILLSMWSDGSNSVTDDLALALSYGDNLDLVLPYLKQCFAEPHSQLHGLHVVKICESLGVQAGDAVSEIAARLSEEAIQHAVDPSTSDFHTMQRRICLDCLAAIGPAAAEALPIVENIREHARPCDVEYIDGVIASISPWSDG